MFKFIALAALSLAASSVSALVVPRSTPPAGYDTGLLEVCIFNSSLSPINHLFDHYYSRTIPTISVTWLFSVI